MAVGLVWIDGRGRRHLPRRIDHGDFHAGAKVGVEAHRHALTGGSGQQQIAQVGGEHAHRFLLRRVP
jgi:hypothetical protein